jgi:hypothetical protein
LHGTRLCRILGLMSPEITLTNQVRWRVAIADRRWREAVELLRTAAAAPGYCGPPLDVVERMAGVIAEVRDQIKAWSIEEQRRRTNRPRIATRPVKRALAELYRS